MAELDEYLTISEVMTLLKVTRGTVYRWMRERRLPYYKLGPEGRRRFKREDVDKLLVPGDPETDPEPDGEP